MQISAPNKERGWRSSLVILKTKFSVSEHPIDAFVYFSQKCTFPIVEDSLTSNIFTYVRTHANTP